MDFDCVYNDYLNYFENSLKDNLLQLNKEAPKTIIDAMKYAILDGGKRIRPILCYATAKMLNVDLEKVKEFALAIEMIHSYSLIHDDLPSMDNDDYRRGKLSTHKKFGEAYGVLAGDALLNYAFETVLSKKDISINDISAFKLLADFAGYSGMIAGQVLDLQSEGVNELNENLLLDIYFNKTAKLIMAPILISSIISGNLYYNELKDFGYNLGVLFQITDDILDVISDLSVLGKTPNKDANSDKFTSVKVFGLEGANIRAKKYYEKAKDSIKNIPNNEFLLQFLEKMYFRNK